MSENGVVDSCERNMERHTGGCTKCVGALNTVYRELFPRVGLDSNAGLGSPNLQIHVFRPNPFTPVRT